MKNDARIKEGDLAVSESIVLGDENADVFDSVVVVLKIIPIKSLTVNFKMISI